ncbi:hypothetical protein BU23DRAFT_421956, partial [Bimuria novae-zelandiae CBS 107.79]
MLAVQMLYALIHFTIKSGFLAFYVQLSLADTFLTTSIHSLRANSLTFHRLLIILRCEPPKEVFSPGSAREAKCIPAAVTFWFPVNVIVDRYILILPIPVIWTLRMPSRSRLAIFAIFSSGFTAIL